MLFLKVKQIHSHVGAKMLCYLAVSDTDRKEYDAAINAVVTEIIDFNSDETFTILGFGGRFRGEERYREVFHLDPAQGGSCN